MNNLRNEFHKMPNRALVELNDAEYKLLGYYIKLSGYRGYCWPSNKTAAHNLGWGKSKLIATKNKLKEKHFIVVEHQYHHNKQTVDKIVPLGIQSTFNIVEEPRASYN